MFADHPPRGSTSFTYNIWITKSFNISAMCFRYAVHYLHKASSLENVQCVWKASVHQKVRKSQLAELRKPSSYPSDWQRSTYTSMRRLMEGSMLCEPKYSVGNSYSVSFDSPLKKKWNSEDKVWCNKNCHSASEHQKWHYITHDDPSDLILYSSLSVITKCAPNDLSLLRTWHDMNWRRIWKQLISYALIWLIMCELYTSVQLWILELWLQLELQWLAD